MKYPKLLLLTVVGSVLLPAFCEGQVITTIAGDGTFDFYGDGGPAINAAFQGTGGVCKDVAGNIYIGDQLSNAIRKVDTNGIITSAGSVWDAQSVTNDAAGNYYVPNNTSMSVTMFDVTTNTQPTIIGGGWWCNGDTCPALGTYSWATYACSDPVGDLYMDQAHTLRKYDAGAGMVYRMAGTGSASYSGDGGLAINAGISIGKGITCDASGNIYFTQHGGYAIRRIDGTTGIITTVAGNGTQGYSGDGGPALNAQLQAPGSLALDINGNLFVSDNGILRKVDKQSGIITTIANVGANEICIDKYGNIIFTNGNGSTVKMVVGDSILSYSPISSFTVQTSSKCNTGLQALIGTPHYSTNYSVTTYFGDGTNSTETLLPGWGGGYAIIEHNYPLSGNYSVKHVLYDGSTPVDSNQYTYKHTLCNTIPLKMYADQDNDCIYTAQTDLNITKPVTVTVDSNGVTIDTLSFINGYNYNAYGNAGDIYTFEIVNLATGLQMSCPVNGIISDTLQSQTLASPDHFGVTCSSLTNFDLSVQASILTPANASHVDILVDNNSCMAQNATLTMTFSPKYEFANANPAPTTQNGNTLTWNINGLSAVSSFPHYISVNLNAANNQILTVGDTVHTSLTLTPTTGDTNPLNNVINSIDTVVAPFDPNAVYVKPGTCVTPGTKLEYTVTFENMGNAVAHNIYIMDTLNNGVEMQSVKILSASHLMTFTKESHGAHNILKFEFPGIDLPDSSSPARHGFVKYLIDTKGNYPIGSAVTNHAGIYFDYMPAVLTTVASTIMCWPASVSTAEKGHLHIYPNPVGDHFIVTGGSVQQISIVNTLGQVVYQQKTSQQETVVNVAHLNAGVYFVTVANDRGEKMVEKVVKQ